MAFSQHLVSLHLKKSNSHVNSINKVSNTVTLSKVYARVLVKQYFQFLFN